MRAFSLPKHGTVYITQDSLGVFKFLADLFSKECAVKIIPTDLPPSFISGESQAGFIDLTCLDAISEEEILSYQKRCFSLSQEFSKKVKEKFLFALCMQVDDEKQLVLNSGYLGLCKTAAQEWEETKIKCLSMRTKDESPEKIAKKIFKEILFGGPDIEVVLENEGRKIWAFEKKERLFDELFSIQKNDIFVVTGGARGITARCIIELARTSPCRFLILGRSSQVDIPFSSNLSESEIQKFILERSSAKISPRELKAKVKAILNAQEVEKNLQVLRDLGCDVLYESIDCLNKNNVILAIQKARTYWNSPISGLIHGAGVLHDRLLGDLTLEQYEEVLNTKVQVALNLLSATRDDDLKCICFFSSVAARWGNRGQSTYAMANEILNKLAIYEKTLRPNCKVKSIDWGPWQGGMVNKSIQKLFEARNVGLLDLDEGSQSFVAELSAQNGVEVVLAQKPLLSMWNKKSSKLFLDLKFISDQYRICQHKIQSREVIPFALVIDWACKISECVRPDLHLLSVDESSCFNGIGSNGEGLFLEYDVAHEEDSAEFVFVIKSEQKFYYRLKVKRAQGSSNRTALKKKKSFNDSNENPQIYDGFAMFHEGDFKVIKKLNFVDKERADSMAVLHKKHRRMFFIEAGIQLAVYWVFKNTNAASLPSSIKRIEFYSEKIPTEVNLHLSGKIVGLKSGLVDVLFTDLEGRELGKMEGLVMTPYASKQDRIELEDRPMATYH